jgi:hypothetical protein
MESSRCGELPVHKPVQLQRCVRVLRVIRAFPDEQKGRRAVLTRRLAANKHQPGYFNFESIFFAMSKCFRTTSEVLLAKLFTSGSVPSFASFWKAARSFS